MSRPVSGPDIRRNSARLALATFGLLALELAAIRWLSGQVRILAYFNNLVLIAAFLGMGLGVALSGRRPHLRHWTLPAVALFVSMIVVASRFGLSELSFPDVSIHLWGGELRAGWVQFLVSLGVVFGLFWAVVGIFVLAGVAVGHYFGRLETLRAYSWDLVGSLLGVVGLAAITGLGVSPPFWFLVGALPFLILSPRPRNAVALAVVMGATWLSIDGAIYSPYNRIDVVADEGEILRLRVNRDFHQYMHDVSDATIATLPERDAVGRLGIRAVYDLPYRVGDGRERALILGAGSGNDAQAAVRAGVREIVAVDIDPRILALGKEMHPERPYDRPEVRTVVNDGRAFLEQYRGEPFDVVSFGFLDSHAMFSTMSSLRLENYVYTEEGLKAAWEHVAEGGVLSVAFSVAAGQWLEDRIYWTLAEAAGKTPTVVPHGMHGGSTFLITKGPLDTARIPFPVRGTSTPREVVATTSDDWPFLYLRPDRFPIGYVLLLLGVLASATLAVRGVFGRQVLSGGFDMPLFAMGAAFLLLETRAVTSLSLLFGTTWLVNASVFSGILLTVLLANSFVIRYKPRGVMVWFLPLFATLALLWGVDVGDLNAFSLGGRWAIGALLVGLPVGLAGVIVSMRLAQSRTPTAALGSNLLGAVFGGCVEYLSMSVGLKTLVLLAAVFYLTAALLLQRARESAPEEEMLISEPPLPPSGERPAPGISPTTSPRRMPAVRGA